ncbi:DUF2149 domain-containing protein [Methanobrevibacter millerae]|uniref:DUF2149 domain-containing protein n=1 Tax=Methanobrevibacter millerae TaxID=230361 RepID=A0A8T3VDQ1_9EURY|nr:DUF2149 domain-containing protein [Methanobrevibacter millerae]MBE6506249.1 DUF2149 domain-containing protein [Methanobrevibacter millerae]MBR0058151.1 DUF2149 domain-containing protein [Methanobrevibacter sp.]
MVRKKQRRRSNRVEEDPMAGTSNLVDAMLVIAVGFLVFVIISWNMQAIVFNEDMTPEQKQQVMQTIKSVSEVNQGQELNETPDTSNSSGQGYTEMGKVYKDPSTGKLIMVEG